MIGEHLCCDKFQYLFRWFYKIQGTKYWNIIFLKLNTNKEECFYLQPLSALALAEIFDPQNNKYMW